MENSNETLISVAKAALRLGVNRNTIARHFPIVRIGGRMLVRSSDVEAKIMEGRAYVAA